MGVLEAKGAVVLGAAARDNMGQHIARKFAEAGAKVVVAGRHGAELDRLAAEIGGHAAICDITDRDQVFALADLARQHLGRVHIAVNATGWGLLKPFLENTPEDIRKMCEIQFTGPFMFFQAMVEAMKDGGSLIQISSATATIMLNDHAAYMGTKAGIDHVIRTIANEFGGRGIRANSISPGITDSPMTGWAASKPGLREVFEDCYPLGRIGTSDDIAAAAVWLASDACFMTGQNLQVNGGLTLRRNPTGAEIAAALAKVRPAE